MANIPVEPRASRPWWLWALLGLGALLLILLFRNCNNEDDVTVDDREDTAGMVDDEPSFAGDTAGLGGTGADGLDGTTGAPTGTAVTTFDDLFVAGAAASMAGRRVDIDRARVVAVTGDSTFIVAPEGDDSRQLVVVLDDAGESAAGGSDGRYDVNEGDVVDLVGTVETYRAGMVGTSELDAGRQRELADRGMVIRTRRLDLREATPMNQ